MLRRRAGPASPPTRTSRRSSAASWREHLGKAFRPSRVVFVPELPRTRSAKILRRAIRATVAGEDAGDLSSLENPSAIDAIRGAVSR